MVTIFELFGKKGTVTVLRHFLENPTGKFYLAQLEKQLRLSKLTILNALGNLNQEYLLGRQQVGRTTLYSLNGGSALAKELKRMLAMATATESLRQFMAVGCQVYLYGSCARGENDEKSDIDILIIYPDKGRINGMLVAIKNEKIKPIIMTLVEYSLLSRNDRPFYERIEKDRVRLF